MQHILQVSFEEIYLFGILEKNIDTFALYNELTQNEKIPLTKEVRVRMKDPVKGAPGKVCLRRIQISSEGDELVATTHTHQGSGNIHSLVAHNGVTYLPPDTGAKAGDIITALWFH